MKCRSPPRIELDLATLLLSSSFIEVLRSITHARCTPRGDDITLHGSHHRPVLLSMPPALRSCLLYYVMNLRLACLANAASLAIAAERPTSLLAAATHGGIVWIISFVITVRSAIVTASST